MAGRDRLGRRLLWSRLAVGWRALVGNALAVALEEFVNEIAAKVAGAFSAEGCQEIELLEKRQRLRRETSRLGTRARPPPPKAPWDELAPTRLSLSLSLAFFAWGLGVRAR